MTERDDNLAVPMPETADSCSSQRDEEKAVGYGCANRCGGIAYFPSRPGDFCVRCRIEADDAARDAAREIGL
jgi:hypothetical protein